MCIIRTRNKLIMKICPVESLERRKIQAIQSQVQGSGEGLDLSQPAINAIDNEWFKAGNTPCFWVPADPSKCDGKNQV